MYVHRSRGSLRFLHCFLACGGYSVELIGKGLWFVQYPVLELFTIGIYHRG